MARSELLCQLEEYIAHQFGSAQGTTAAIVARAVPSLTATNRLLNPTDTIINPPDTTLTASPDTYPEAAPTQFFMNCQQPGQTLRFQRDGYFSRGQTVTGHTPAP